MSSEESQSTLEWIGLVMEVGQAIGTVLIAILGFVYFFQERKKQEYENRRQIISDATSQINMDFAFSVFRDRMFHDKIIAEQRIYDDIFSPRLQSPTTTLYRQCRSELIVFLEALRQVALIIGPSEFAIEGPTDPILFKFRVSMIAFGDYWSPQNRDGNFSYCNDVNREFIKSYYGTDHEWHLLCIAATRVGLEYDRYTGPWMTTPTTKKGTELDLAG